MKFLKFLTMPLMLAVLLMFTGCEHAKQVSQPELMKLTKKWEERRIAIWYYIGTEGDFHYFMFHDLGTKKMYKIKKEEIEIKNPFPKTEQQARWEVMPWGPLVPHYPKEN